VSFAQLWNEVEHRRGKAILQLVGLLHDFASLPQWTVTAARAGSAPSIESQQPLLRLRGPVVA
jgi:hypothetical protein